MIGDTPCAPCEVYSEIERRSHRIASNRNVGGSSRRAVAFLNALQRDLLGLENEPVAIHRPAVLFPQVSDAARVGSRRRRLREPDGFERSFRAQPKQHLFRPAGGGNEPDADLDETNIGFSRSTDAIAVQ